MAAKDKNTRLKSNMAIAFYPATTVGRLVPDPKAVIGRPKEPESEHDVEIYTIIIMVLAVFVFLRLRSVLGQRTGSERPFRVSAFAYRLSMIASVLCAVSYVAYEAKWYSALAARVTPITTISGPARVIDGDTVVAGVLLAMALLLGTALVLSFLHWKDWKAQRINPGLLHQKTQRFDPGIEREFNKVFMTTSKEGKQALIKRWMDRKKCDREEAMRLAIEELRRDNR
jgi:hypothetical protein